MDFESGESWWDGLRAAGFDPDRPAVVASTGVSMYLTKEATADTLRQLAALAPGSTVAMTFLLPAELVDEADRPGLEASTRGARGSGTPFISFYTPDEMKALALDAGFRDVQNISSRTLVDRYFAGRSDGLRPSSGEELIVART
jgi:O-methyltransferase involved in polyketide biosynthesis